ncbi:hypothetical protein DPM13_03980 [Paracoccus mutanolyticus]|uniref:Uncharacterized protein n=1 Tax=Paracoccus mutanolyticus TaxID=1499308 RepID=A0ABM6WPZ8_9RHOB|nr:hypothetical protein DPM13_03980 [Paracoccus mutanolyticus]
MRMSPAFLFMEDDGARLAVQLQPLFGHLHSRLEHLDRYGFTFGRVQAEREQEVLERVPCEIASPSIDAPARSPAGIPAAPG